MPTPGYRQRCGYYSEDANPRLRQRGGRRWGSEDAIPRIVANLWFMLKLLRMPAPACGASVADGDEDEDDDANPHFRRCDD